MAAQEPTNACPELRSSIGEQLKQARLNGDKVQLTMLEENLQVLNARCRGMSSLQANHIAVERANQLTSEREAQLREALAKGNPEVIDLRSEQLDQARRQLKAAKR